MPKYLIKCDISGIQGFIFDVPSDGAARQLKARSFYVIAITEIAYEYLSKQLSLAESIYKSGGNFFAYFEAESEEKLKQVFYDFQKEFFQESIFPIFAYTKATDDFKQDMQAVARAANLAKLQKPFFTETFDFKPYQAEKWENFTKKLVESQGFVIEERTEKGNPFSKAGFTFSLQKNNLQFEGKILNKIPTDKDKSITEFDEITQKATGDAKLAALAIDVDNLSSLFRDKEKKEYKSNSENLTDFFEKELYNILKEFIQSQEIYPVFAGGDDCFLVGAWNKILNAAHIIQDNFEKYKKEKKFDNTLSAGVVIVSPKFPMVRMAEEAENALSTAKSNDKDKICIFGEVLSWQDFAKASEIAGKLKKFIEDNELPRNLLHRLQSSELGFTSLQEKKAGKIYFPRIHRLYYYLRNVEKDSEAGKYLKTLFDKYKEALLNNFLHKGGENPALYVVAARWAELLTKSANKEN